MFPRLSNAVGTTTVSGRVVFCEWLHWFPYVTASGRVVTAPSVIASAKDISAASRVPPLHEENFDRTCKTSSMCARPRFLWKVQQYVAGRSTK